MKFDGASTGVGAAKSAGFDYSFSFKDNEEENKKTKFDNFPGGIFTMPNNSVAFNHSTGGRDDGAFNA